MIDKICEHMFIKKLVNKNSVVLDLGANSGEFSKIISERYGCKVYAVEPIPNLFELIPRTSLIKKIQAAVASKSGMVNIYLPEDRCATMYDKSTELMGKSISASAFSFEDLIKKIGISKVDLIKIDIEGEEVLILEALTPGDINKIDQWTIEFHDFLYPELHDRVENIKKKIVAAGFFCVPFSITNNGDVLFIKRNSISLATYFYLKYFLRYFFGFFRKLRKAFKILSGKIVAIK